MKTARKSTIYDLNAKPTFGSTIAGTPRGVAGAQTTDALTAVCPAVLNRKSSIVNRKSREGIALVITLIMLSVTLVMAVAFLALAKRERGSVSTGTDTTVARLAADTAVANAQAQLVAGIMSGLATNGVSSNAYNLHLFVSTNYINPRGFVSGLGSPTNVNYYYANGNPLSLPDLEQNIANLWFLPRPPVFVANNPSIPGYDFRYYLDLNENGAYDPNGWQPVTALNPPAGLWYFDTNGNHVAPASLEPPNVLSNFFVGDPEWVGILEHPDAPHGPNNHFTSRYAFIAVPAGNSLDFNYIHNQALNTTLLGNDGYMRNQGVGSWELNLAAFLADLNTNYWGRFVWSGLGGSPASSYYQYERYANLNSANSGYAFQDAFTLLRYRYNTNSLLGAYNYLSNAVNRLPVNGIDNYSSGPLQTNLDYNRSIYPPPLNARLPWSGADNTNHFFTPGDFFDINKTAMSVPNTLMIQSNYFTARLQAAGTSADTYDRYTFYRMLDQLGSDSSAEDGRLNLNYANAVVSYKPPVNGVALPASIGVVAGTETNLVRWTPLNFFHAAADQMLRLYSSNWCSANYVAFTNTFAVTAPFSITNIPVWVSNRFVYTPAVHRLLQLAANIYDATTNGNFNLPHVFRPVVERVNNNGDIFIVGYVPVTFVSGTADRQLAAPYTINQLSRVPMNAPIANAGVPINVYGVPWIIGAKKGLPNFNQFSMLTAAQVTRKMEISRSSLNPRTARYTTNQMYIIGISNSIGVNFWNSYTNNYPRPLTVYASDIVSTVLTNGAYKWTTNNNFVVATNVPVWAGSQWFGQPPNAALRTANSILQFNWPCPFQSPLAYNFNTAQFDPTFQWQTTSPPLPPLPQFGLLITNCLQAYILDGNNVIDYVQLRDPVSVGGLNQALADPNYARGNNIYYQWSTNVYPSAPPTTWGPINQIWVSGHPLNAPVAEQWSVPPPPTPMNNVSPAAEAAFFNGFFTPTFTFNGTTYVNREEIVQVPYTPSRTVYSSYLLQANDPLVHYLSSDLNAQVGTKAVWSANNSYVNGLWYQSDNPSTAPLPPTPPPLSPVKGRYQPWGNSGQMIGAIGVDQNTYNLAYKDPLMWASDNWDFPTNLYPTVGWLGRVHRGTPWQTVYLKSTNIFSLGTSAFANMGLQTWASWTGDIGTNYYTHYFDSYNSGPQQDFWLFDLFTTRLNDNSVRGTLPVNVGMGRPDGGLAAWSALFSGMAVITNSAPVPISTTPLTYTYQIANPAGVDVLDSPLWKMVNGPNGINATRANTNLFPNQAFTHVGNILATPALSVASPFLNTNATLWSRPTLNQLENGINDEEYEWLPQQMMGLVRPTEQRYVLYCWGQTLRPAPGGTVLSGSHFQLVTNYQIVAESVVRAVVRVDNANTSQPHTVVESYNVLPPN